MFGRMIVCKHSTTAFIPNANKRIFQGVFAAKSRELRPEHGKRFADGGTFRLQTSIRSAPLGWIR